MSSTSTLVFGGRPLGRFLLDELRPRGRFFTPFNLISIVIMLLAAAILVVRFTQGLGSVTNLDQRFPWGLWIGFDVITGVAFAGGAYVLTFLVYILRLDQYKPIVRATVLNGFLAYVFYAGALLLDLGRPWNVINPIIGNQFGLTSVLFLVAWHFMLYMAAEAVEFSPAVAEWLGWWRARKILAAMTLGAVIFGITLSTLHQSGLGALYMMAKPKIHPLWYSELIPVLFFVSSIFAGLSMVIFEGSISHRVFAHRVGPDLKQRHDAILLGLGKICAVVLFVYLFLQTLTLLHDREWVLLGEPFGRWYLFEMGFGVILPMILFLRGTMRSEILLIKVAAVITMLGVILNRLNISVIAFKWYESNHYYPSWQEIVVTLAVISAEIWVLRWIVLRLPVLNSISPPSEVAEKATVERSR